MFVLTNLLLAIAGALWMLLTAYFYILLGRVIVSWVNADPRNPIVRFLFNATEPLLWRVRRMLPYMSGVDLSPLVVSILIYVARGFLVGTLTDLAYRLQ
ncbi:MAG: YggT family protein [Deltaproteobacteria bacterium]|nr:YggT family protein [Deltaproteobacteria bacterium]